MVAGYEITRAFELTHAGIYQIGAEYLAEKVPAPLQNENVFVGRLRASVGSLTLE